MAFQARKVSGLLRNGALDTAVKRKRCPTYRGEYQSSKTSIDNGKHLKQKRHAMTSDEFIKHADLQEYWP